jgi:hypothetical protein
VESGLHGSRRDAEGLGDLGNRQPEVEVEDDDHSLVWLQAPEAALELITISQRCRTVVRPRLEVDDPDLCGPAALAAALVGTRIDEESMKPGVEAIELA